MNIDTPELSPAQIERLAILAEECAETIQMVNKILRFGWESVHPFLEDQKTNRERLSEELRDILVATLLLIENKDIRRETLEWGPQYVKRLKMSEFVSYQSDHSPKDVQVEFAFRNLPKSST
jgi:NTP pyrophosphatase (non-canonical NTP hydrolase)